MTRFYDTCALLELQEKAFEPNSQHFLISNITLTELESIKISATKDDNVKYKARKVISLLKENLDKYTVIMYIEKDMSFKIKNFGFIENNDARIIATAYSAIQEYPDLAFITSDLSCYALGKAFGLHVISLEEIENIVEDEYTGFKEIDMTDDELAAFYNEYIKSEYNKYSLKRNEYLIIKNNNEIINKYKWTGKSYQEIPYYQIKSNIIGKIAPKDEYQQLVLDSLHTNQLTVIRGKAGSGKSLLALGYFLHLLEKGKIDKIVIFANPVAVRGAAKLGFYPGSKDDKLLDSQIGNFLVSKLGGIIEVEKMISEGTLILVPCADCRGMDLTGLNAGVLVTEAQNLSRDMMKLILQRTGEDSKIIVEGDDKAQVDMAEYSGHNNGLKAVSKAFRGYDIYGEIELNKIYRSKIATIADTM